MNQESVNKALRIIERGIIVAKENIGKGYEVKRNEEGLADLIVCKDALEKQIGITPDGECCCKVCGTYSCDDEGIQGELCPNCGQKLDWEESE